jgi:hypothetical protein
MAALFIAVGYDGGGTDADCRAASRATTPPAFAELAQKSRHFPPQRSAALTDLSQLAMSGPNDAIQAFHRPAPRKRRADAS